MRGGRVSAVVALAGAALLLGGGSVRAAGPAHTPAVATIRVAQFNCDISDEFPIIKASLVARAIRASGADVVGIEEGAARSARSPARCTGATTTSACRSPRGCR